jgi:hypothetical protein
VLCEGWNHDIPILWKTRQLSSPWCKSRFVHWIFRAISTGIFRTLCGKVNSPHAVYQIAPKLLEVLRAYNTAAYDAKLSAYLSVRTTLAEMYAKRREMAMVPLKVREGTEILLSAGEHSALIKRIVEEFSPRFVAGGRLACVGDTGENFGHFDADLLKLLGVVLDNHGKLPDVAIYAEDKRWLFPIESVTSHGPVDSKRHIELKLLSNCSAGLVFVSAFPNRKAFLKYIEAIPWETEVWIADAPSHMIHFNGARFLGPYGGETA